MGIINKKGLKKEFNKGFVKIGNNILENFIKIKEEEIKKDIEKIVRNAKLSSRKVIRKEDIFS